MQHKEKKTLGERDITNRQPKSNKTNRMGKEETMELKEMMGQETTDTTSRQLRSSRTNKEARVEKAVQKACI